jgi:hypothetical protein
MSVRVRCAPLLLAALAIVVATGCGGTERGETRRTSHRPPPPIVSLLYDCSRFRDQAAYYLPDMIRLARAVAQARQVLEYACVDGSPLTTADLKIVDFSEPLGGTNSRGVPQDPELILERDERWVRELRGRFRRMIADGRQRKWSGLLEGLMIPARQPRVRTVWFWTDGEIRDPTTHFSLPHASQQRMEREIRAWVDRLRGLGGKQIVMIGLGRGAVNEPTVFRAEWFFHTLLVTRVRARLHPVLRLDEVEPAPLLEE